jgi:hypothetical protein
MGAMRDTYYKRILPLWLAFADAVGGFLEEVAFRVELAFKVLAGRVPIETEKRPWVRSVNRPVLVDAYDWTTDRRLFSVLVWPPLEISLEEASSVHLDRLEQVKEVVCRGAAQMAVSLYLETDYGLRWDNDRECWIDSHGHRYDGSRFGAGSRSPDHVA